MPPPALLDTIYRLWLNAVVLEELYAGAKTKDRNVIARSERDFGRVGRILIPSLGDWVEAGPVLAQVGSRYGYEQIGRGRLTNDALIAMSAARYGCTVLTANERAFSRLAEFRPFRYEVIAEFRRAAAAGLDSICGLFMWSAQSCRRLYRHLY